MLVRAADEVHPIEAEQLAGLASRDLPPTKKIDH